MLVYQSVLPGNKYGGTKHDDDDDDDDLAYFFVAKSLGPAVFVEGCRVVCLLSNESKSDVLVKT